MTLGQQKPSGDTASRVKTQCPAFKDACPFASVKTFAEFASRWGEVPTSHFDLIGGSDQMVSYLLKSVRRAVNPEEDDVRS